MLMSNTYYKALDRPNADVVTEPIAEVGPRSITTADGVTREADVIIYGTGFDTQAMASSVEIQGEGGHRLAELWQREGIQAHRGTMIAGFPNLFFLLGPNTGLGPQLRRLHDRVPDPAGRPGDRGGAAAKRLGGAHRARSGVLQLEDAVRPGWRRVVARLQELVPGRPGAQHHALAGGDVPLLRVDAKARSRRVRMGRAQGADSPAASGHRELAEVA